jgi:hypothetical protein
MTNTERYEMHLSVAKESVQVSSWFTNLRPISAEQEPETIVSPTSSATEWGHSP